jgi:4-hydroxy-tetrahydrodipicolinate reductase
MTTKVAIVGASGKMGRLVARLVEEADDFELVAKIGSSGDLEDLLGADIAVDVTTPAASPAIVEFAVSHGIRTLVGTSGWSGERIAVLEHSVAARGDTGVIIVPNFSLGSVLATTFATMAAAYFDSVEIVEAHQLAKIDSPSGTAIRTAELIGKARAAAGPVMAPHSDQRARGQKVAGVPVHSLRLAGVVARQDVIFGGTGELLTLTHQTLAPTAYEAGIRLALGAVRTVTGVVVGLDKLLALPGSSLLAGQAGPSSASDGIGAK